MNELHMHPCGHMDECYDDDFDECVACEEKKEPDPIEKIMLRTRRNNP